MSESTVKKLALTVLIGSALHGAYSDAATYCDEQQAGKRRRPGQEACVPRPPAAPGETPAARAQSGTEAQRFMFERTPSPLSPLPRPQLQDYPEAVPVPDRWRIVDTLGYVDRWYDPYNRNILKGDKPVHGDWFFSLGIVSDTVYEKRQVATPVGSSSSNSAGAYDTIGASDQWALQQSLAVEFVYYKGDTTFRPPDYEFRFIPVINYNYTVLDEVQGINANPDKGRTRTDSHVGIQGAFADVHLRNVSAHYDFDSIRFGIQPFTADFRSFLFNDSPFGVRLFGTRDNNIFQYNLAWFRRLEKNTNSGLNDVGGGLRDDDVFVANLYWQDLLVKGFTSQVTLLHNRNRETKNHYDDNDILVRPASIGREVPHSYDVTYLGYSGDGHIGRTNLSVSAYAALGDSEGTNFRRQKTDIAAFFAAAEVSRDFDWLRVRLSALYASGDDDPYDDKDTGFDAILENPQFAGADSSYWIRQAVPLIGGGGVALSGRNGLLPSLRSSKDEGQSNFANPGLLLLGIGADADVLPELRISANWNVLRFADTTVLEVARNQGDIDAAIGNDVSVSAIYRPLLNQNIVLRASYAKLFTAKGYDSLLKDENPSYLLLNAVFAY